MIITRNIKTFAVVATVFSLKDFKVSDEIFTFGEELDWTKAIEAKGDYKVGKILSVAEASQLYGCTLEQFLSVAKPIEKRSEVK